MFKYRIVFVINFFTIGTVVSLESGIGTIMSVTPRVINNNQN